MQATLVQMVKPVIDGVKGLVKPEYGERLEGAVSYGNTMASLFYDDLIVVLASMEGLAGDVTAVREVTVEVVDGNPSSHATTGPGALPGEVLRAVEELAERIADWLRGRYGERAGRVLKDSLYRFIRYADNPGIEDEDLAWIIREVSRYRYLRASLPLALEKLDSALYREMLNTLALLGIPSGAPSRFTLYKRHDLAYLGEKDSTEARTVNGYRKGLYS